MLIKPEILIFVRLIPAVGFFFLFIYINSLTGTQARPLGIANAGKIFSLSGIGGAADRYYRGILPECQLNADEFFKRSLDRGILYDQE